MLYGFHYTILPVSGLGNFHKNKLVSGVEQNNREFAEAGVSDPLIEF